MNEGPQGKETKTNGGIRRVWLNDNNIPSTIKNPNKSMQQIIISTSLSFFAPDCMGGHTFPT